MGNVIMLTFPTRGQMLDGADYLRNRADLKINHMAIIAKAEDGETTVLEDDVNADEGAVAGGTLGSLLGGMGIAGLGAFLLPGIGPILAIGAGALLGGLLGGATGGLTAKVVDLGINNDQLNELASRLKTGNVALVLDVDATADVVAALPGDVRSYSAEYTAIPSFAGTEAAAATGAVTTDSLPSRIKTYPSTSTTTTTTSDPTPM